MENQTVNQRYNQLLKAYRDIQDASPKNTLEFQTKLLQLIKEFKLIKSMIDSLDLFSDNEFFEEINPLYLPYLNVEYYLGELTSLVMSDGSQVGVEFKPKNLEIAKDYFKQYLQRIKQFEILNSVQQKQIKGEKLSRGEKIQQYKYEKELQQKIETLKSKDNDDVDEEFKRELYGDEIRSLVIKCLGSVEMLDMELAVLNNRKIVPLDEPSKNSSTTASTTDFSTRLDRIPKNIEMKDLIKNGKILQPFTITREALREKVFGTGQVLPSMTVEEYLDYELANGKLMKPEEPIKEVNSDDEEEELKNREWDDWKDENPKGIGNTMNLG